MPFAGRTLAGAVLLGLSLSAQPADLFSEGPLWVVNAPKFKFDAAKARPVWGLTAQAKKLALTSRAPGETFSFAVIGDAEPGRFWFERIFPPRGKKVFETQMRRLQANNPDFVLQLGDIVSDRQPRPQEDEPEEMGG